MMKNKLTLVFTVIFSLIGFFNYGQDDLDSNQQHKKFYVRAAFGVMGEVNKTAFNNVDLSGSTGIRPSTDITVNAEGVTVNSLFGTFGEGTRANLVFGYMCNKYLGFELGASYNIGRETLVGRYEGPDALGTPTLSVQEGQLSFFDFSPSLLLTPGFTKLNPYTRVGLSIPVFGKLEINTSVDRDTDGQNPPISVNATSEVEGQFSLGFIGAVGVQYILTDNLNIFGEVEYKALHTKGQTVTVTKFETKAVLPNGETVLIPGQQLEDRAFGENNFIFSESYNAAAANPNEATKIPNQASNANSVGINIGLYYKF